jgi:DNA-binding CsgD family transcriptional regulator
MNALVNARSEPCILILDVKKQITFANPIALEVFKFHNGSRPGRNRPRSFKIPEEISLIHAELKSMSDRLPLESPPDAVYLKKTIQILDSRYMVRAFVISDSKARPSLRFLILLDKLSIRSKFDLDHARAYYRLSIKEFEVVQLLVGGLTNKEIGNKLCIAESTVKEYLRNIMSKVGASTRCGVVAQVLSLFDRDPGNGASNGETSLSSAPLDGRSLLESPEFEATTEAI